MRPPKKKKKKNWEGQGSRERDGAPLPLEWCGKEVENYEVILVPGGGEFQAERCWSLALQKHRVIFCSWCSVSLGFAFADQKYLKKDSGNFQKVKLAFSTCWQLFVSHIHCIHNYLHGIFIRPYCAFQILCFYCRLVVTLLSTSLGAIFAMKFAPFLTQSHLIVLVKVQTFSSLVHLLWQSVISDLWWDYGK